MKTKRPRIQLRVPHNVAVDPVLPQEEQKQVVDADESSFHGYYYVDKDGNKAWTEDYEESIGE